MSAAARPSENPAPPHELSAEFRAAPWIDPNLAANDPCLHAWTQSMSAIDSALARGLRSLLANILKHGAPRYLTLSKSWSDYPAPSRYCRQPLALSSMIAATEFLRDRGWLRIHPGSKASGLRTRIEITEEFKTHLQEAGLITVTASTPTAFTAEPCEEPIVLRDEAGALVDYTDTRRTCEFRNILVQINAFLTKQKVSHHGRLLHTQLVRIFKNSFLEGGRFYRAEHLALKSAERAELTLNDEPVCEVDFACMHIHMLYLRETGRPFDGDAYQTESIRIPRDVFKIILQIILNCTSKYGAELAVAEALKVHGLNSAWAGQAIAVFLNKHAAIAKYFFSGIGVRLQYEDSLIAERVLLAAVRDNVAILPVHDSFLVPVRHEAWLQNTMQQASVAVLGGAVPVKTKRPLREQTAA